MFEGQPKGLYALALANTGERFGYYTMLAVFVLFLKANFGWEAGTAGAVYSSFLALVYLLPLFGGMLADKIGYSKCVTTGIIVMFLGYAMLSIPAGAGTVAAAIMFGALIMISVGTSLFKGNLQVMVGDLYNSPEMQGKRDSAFSIFYMAINIGALFAPTAAVKIMEYAQHSLGVSEADSYHYAFGVACISLIVSIGIYYGFQSTFKQVISAPAPKTAASKDATAESEPELSKQDTKDRIVALCLVFAVVIFFWMAFHQNGSALTFFAKKYTDLQVGGGMRFWFNIFSLALIAVAVYTGFAIFQSKKIAVKIICGIITGILLAIALGMIIYYIFFADGEVKAQPSDFQQFNPFFVVALTPFSMLFFGSLAKKGKEVSAPMRIGLGMFVAAIGFTVILFSSFGLTSPMDLGQDATQPILSPNWLISTYFTLTIAELLLSPMGISFVTKVAPPKYKGLMMGGWFVATAIGNYLSSIPSQLWDKIPLVYNWAILIGLCLISAIVMFALLKKLKAMTA